MAERSGRAAALIAVGALLVAACGDSPKRPAATTTASTATAPAVSGATTAAPVAESVQPALPAVTVTGAKPRPTPALARLGDGEAAGARADPDADPDAAEDAVATRARSQRVAEPQSDDALDPATGLRPAPGPLQRFQGTRSDIEPPDAIGAIGADQYVLATNRSLLVLGRDGARLKQMSINELWASAGGRCATTPRGDPALIYDEDAQRFVLTQFAWQGDLLEAETFQCLAISDSADALGPWTVHSFRWGERFHDYPKIGVAAGAYALTAYSTVSSGASLTRMALVDRSAMLAGTEPKVQLVDVGTGWLPLIPADADGALPPAGSPAVFAGISDDNWSDGTSSRDEVVIVQVPIDFSAATPSPSVIRLAAAGFDSTLCDGDYSCVPQPGTNQKLDALGEYTMSRVPARVAEDGTARLVLAADVQAGADDRSGVRWIEIADPYGASPSIAQQGTFAPGDGISRFIATPALDAAGNLAVAYAAAGPDLKPGVRYAARAPSDPPGRLPIGEGVLIDGEDVQTGVNRWGDYGSLTLDPDDGCTFWLAGQFAPAGADQSNHRGAATDVVTFRLPGCG